MKGKILIIGLSVVAISATVFILRKRGYKKDTCRKAINTMNWLYEADPASNQWRKDIEKKAKTNNISIEEQIVRDVLWGINKEDPKFKLSRCRFKHNLKQGLYQYVKL